MTSSSDDTTSAGERRGAGPRSIAWVDGRVIPSAEATVPLMDEGFLRGDAVFEAILVRRGRTHALDAHLARMRRSAAELDLRLPVLRRPVGDLLAAWGTRDGVLRLVVTRGGAVRGIMGTVSWPEAISLAVVRAPWRSPLSGVKTLSYAANQWASRQARSRGADDALVIENDTVLELPTGAVCLVVDGSVLTPDPARLPILDSVTLRELAKVLEIHRGVPDVDLLRRADEVFVVSATRPVLAVHAIGFDEDDDLELPAPGPVTEHARDALHRHIDDNLDT